ncbi:nitroreductase family protein [Mycobacterium sp. URHB0044]|uniref:nitroreductase family protein n=1 Tax=Mycobacterium sp. URHB0044 TaxID=1380386 RepID=UPI00068625ED|nr:nitroreductase family protein [Mycobacterium sp. URHB0044]
MPISKPSRTAELVDFLGRARRYAWRQRHRLSGTALGRERRYVRRGIHAYERSVGSGTDVYLLRRNVHRLEKGLTMRPVRNQFATDYIGATVDAFHGGVSAGTLEPAQPEFNWMYSVLARYFDVTATSTHPSIIRSRNGFRDAIADLDTGSADSGPHHAIPLVPTVKIDDFEALAAGRRSVRWFTTESVSRDLVDRAVAIAAESPTACNRQPYRFEIFDDPVSTARVAAIPMGTDGYEHQIPGLIVIVGNLAAFFDQRDRHLIYIDGCLAAMGLVYGLEAQGVNSCCINWPDLPDREAEMRKLLGLARHERVVMLIAYGYADPDALVPFSAKRVVDDIRRFRTL